MAQKIVKTQDPAGVVTSVSSDEAIVLLRRLLRLLESGGVVDAQNRQRITLDAMTGGLILATVNSVAAVTNVAAVAGLDQRQFMDTARIAYATGIRAKLT